MVTLLRDAAAGFIGDSSEFHTQLMSSTDRLKTMTGIDDIRELKKQLSSEVSSLQRVVGDKQKRDQQVIEKLSEKVEVLKADLHKAEEEASLDSLTRIPNRGSFDRTLASMVRKARAASTPLTLAMVDIDHFKTVNDTHGHQVGDRVLLCTAEWLRSSLRRTDFVARYGGEEFAVILADADLKQAETRFTQVLTQIAGRDYDYESGGEKRSVRFTVSCGVSQLAGHDTEPELIHRADQALYEAKRKGRNRVVTKKASLFGRFL
jgi:diguanylate cyclase